MPLWLASYAQSLHDTHAVAQHDTFVNAHGYTDADAHRNAYSFAVAVPATFSIGESRQQLTLAHRNRYAKPNSETEVVSHGRFVILMVMPSW